MGEIENLCYQEDRKKREQMIESVIFSWVFAFVICIYIWVKAIQNKSGRGNTETPDQHMGESNSHSEELKWRLTMRNINSSSWKEVSCENVRKFQYGDFPEIIYVIKTGFDGMYLVANEDAYEHHMGKTTLMTKSKVEKTYNIKLNKEDE